MIFSQKSKGYFLDQNEHSTVLARTSGLVPPFEIEEVQECASGDDEQLKAMAKAVLVGKGASNYLPAICGIYPARRVIRRATLDPKKVKEANYFVELITQQLRVEAEKHTFLVLNANDGKPIDLSSEAFTKEVLFVGSYSEDFDIAQKSLLENGIYPNRLELGTVPSIGAVINHLRKIDSKSPTLVLEMGQDSTNSMIVTTEGIDISRPIQLGINSIIPIVQKELSLKDEESAKKLFYSNTFDFTSMGSKLVGRLMKELQSSIGFYEVQTGQSIGQLYCMMMSRRVSWLETSIANMLGVSVLNFDVKAWLLDNKITVAPNVKLELSNSNILGVASLMVENL